MRLLLLEDDLLRISEFERRAKEHKLALTVVSSATACIRLLEIGLEKKTVKYDLICLDHDLGGEIFVDTKHKNTGSEVARWISEHPESVKGALVVVHSFNPAGAKNMVSLIPGSVYAPAVWTKSNFDWLLEKKQKEQE